MSPIITVLGEGAWGSAIASILADNGYQVRLWCYHADVAEQIRKTRTNDRFVPNTILSSLIKPYTDIKESVLDADYIFEAIPMQFLRSVLDEIKDVISSKTVFVVTSKGVDAQTGMLPTELIESICGKLFKSVVLAGPGFSFGVMKKERTGFIVASEIAENRSTISHFLSNKYILTEDSKDVIGVQLCAALKNVVALGSGILEGIQCGENTRALFLTKAFQEMAHIVVYKKGDSETVYNLAGIGDLILTALSGKSRNVIVGRFIGQGKQIETILSETLLIPESINTLKALPHLLDNHWQESFPLFYAIFETVFLKKSCSLFWLHYKK